LCVLHGAREAPLLEPEPGLARTGEPNPPIRKPSGRQVRRRNLPSPRKRMKQAADQIDQIWVPES